MRMQERVEPARKCLEPRRRINLQDVTKPPPKPIWKRN